MFGGKKSYSPVGFVVLALFSWFLCFCPRAFVSLAHFLSFPFLLYCQMKLKTNLKLAITRLQMLEKKHGELHTREKHSQTHKTHTRHTGHTQDTQANQLSRLRDTFPLPALPSVLLPFCFFFCFFCFFFFFFLLLMLLLCTDNASVLARKEVANLLGNKRVELAKIKVEQVIRDDYYREALEILETYCSLALARFGLIESVQYCDPGIRKAVCTIVWATPRVSVDIAEFKEISKQFSQRYGKEFADAARANSGKEVCPRVMQKLNFVVPDTSLVIGYLEAIAKQYRVEWEPKPSDYDTVSCVGLKQGLSSAGIKEKGGVCNRGAIL